MIRYEFIDLDGNIWMVAASYICMHRVFDIIYRVRTHIDIQLNVQQLSWELFKNKCPL